MTHRAVDSGHAGVCKTEQRLKALFYWPKMQAMIRKYVRSCKLCQLVAARKVNERAPLQQVDVMATHAFDDVTLDFMGGQLPVSANGNRHLLLIICNTSKWLHGIPVRNLRAETIAEKLLQFSVSMEFLEPCIVTIIAHFTHNYSPRSVKSLA